VKNPLFDGADTITEWINGGGVSENRLIAELEYWLDFWKAKRASGQFDAEPVESLTDNSVHAATGGQRFDVV